METYKKDPELKGIYVKRCKCGARPYSDRIYGLGGYWIACNCGRKGLSGSNLTEGIQFWNDDKLSYREMTDEAREAVEKK